MKASKTDKFAVANLTIIHNVRKSNPRYKGETIGGESSKGKAEVFEVTGRNVYLEIIDISWQNGERDIRVQKVFGPLELRRLEHGGLRIGIRKLKGKKCFLELRQGRVKLDSPNHWSNVFKASKKELDEGSGVNSFHFLKKAGGVDIGTKEDLISCKDNTRSYLCAIFPESAIFFPVVAFVLTRILPLLNIYTVK